MWEMVETEIPLTSQERGLERSPGTQLGKKLEVREKMGHPGWWQGYRGGTRPVALSPGYPETSEAWKEISACK